MVAECQQRAFDRFKRALDPIGIRLSCGPEYIGFDEDGEMNNSPFWSLCQKVSIDNRSEGRFGSLLIAAILLAGEGVNHLTFSGLQGGFAFLLETPDQKSLVRVGQKGDGHKESLRVAWAGIPELLQPIKSRELPVRVEVRANYGEQYNFDCLHLVPRVIPMDKALESGLYPREAFEAWVDDADTRIKEKYNLTFFDIRPSEMKDQYTRDYFTKKFGKYFSFNFGLMILPDGEKHVVLIDPGSLKVADPTKPFTQEDDPKLFDFQRQYLAAFAKGELAEIIRPRQAGALQM